MNVFTVPMKLMTAVVLDETTDRVKQELLRLGIVDFIEVKRLAPQEASHLSDTTGGEDPQEYSELRQRIETLFSQGRLRVPSSESLDPKSMESISLEEARRVVDRIIADLSGIRERQKQISQEKIRVEEMWRYVKGRELNYIDIHIGKTAANLETIKRNLEANAYELLENSPGENLSLLTLRRDRAQVNRALDALQWTENPEGELQQQALEFFESHLKAKLERLEDFNAQIRGEVEARIQKEQEKLEKLWANLRLHELVGRIASNFSHTRNTSIFSGWVPAKETARVAEAINRASDNKCVIEWIDAKNMPREEIPTAVQESSLLRPFQRLVDNYDTVEYGTINPTPFVAVAYLAMFGLMFADAGQGLVI
ncbi:MAG: V-type ATPase 116kDa subunit family protein, partial [Sphaerochaetaceae bacterium]